MDKGKVEEILLRLRGIKGLYWGCNENDWGW